MYNHLTIHRLLMKLPLPTLQLEDQFGRFAELECMLTEIQSESLRVQLQCADKSERICWANLSPLWHRFWHPLSEQAMTRSRHARFQTGRSTAERQVTDRIVPLLLASIGKDDATDFVTVVESIVCYLDGSQQGFRKSAIFLRADAMGARVEFPGIIHIVPRLEELHAYIGTYLGKYPLFVALVSMVAILNCHPFSDCNGRSARIVFNAILKISTNIPDLYIPLYEIFWRCGCGWELRMRYAEICGDWKPLYRFIVDVLYLAHSFVQPAVMQKGHCEKLGMGGTHVLEPCNSRFSN